MRYNCVCILSFILPVLLINISVLSARIEGMTVPFTAPIPLYQTRFWFGRATTTTCKTTTLPF